MYTLNRNVAFYLMNWSKRTLQDEVLSCS